MEDRIRQFMEYKGISASDLAGMLDVQRSNISHILNGRNQPGAGFIQKLKSVFKELDLNWLYSGEGNMVVSAQDLATKTESPKPSFIPETKTVLNSDSAKAGMPVQELDIVQAGDSGYKSDRPRKPEKIVIMYSDKTFSEYRPE